MQNPPHLDNITIVLVNTRTPANIGSAARCMMNMGLTRLVLVNPLKPVDEEAYKLAAGADDIIRQATITYSLADAVAGHNLVIGTSRHAGKQRKNLRTPREWAAEALPLLERNRVAVLFGNEVNGLDNPSLAVCHEIVAIPSSDAFPSLNLSHAVMVIGYELFSATLPVQPHSDRELARSDDLENFYRHLQVTLESIGFLDREQPERMMFSLRQLFGRSRPDSRDLKILRGILTAVTKSCNK